MALHITNSYQIFQLSGRLNNQVVYEAKAFFTHKLSHTEELTIDVSQLDDIDLSGAMLLNDLYTRALKDRKGIRILIRDNQKVLGPFRQLNAEYILAA